jgi:hypothetical protein
MRSRGQEVASNTRINRLQPRAEMLPFTVLRDIDGDAAHDLGSLQTSRVRSRWGQRFKRRGKTRTAS